MERCSSGCSGLCEWRKAANVQYCYRSSVVASFLAVVIVFGGRVHYVLVVLMLRVIGLRYVFDSVKEFRDFYWELWVVGDPCGYGGQVV